MAAKKRLSPDEERFIIENCDQFTDKELAAQIGVSDKTIYRCRERHGKTKVGHGPIKKIQEEIKESRLSDGEKENLLAMNRSELKQYYKKELAISERGKRLKSNLIDSSWKFFEERWVEFKMQFEDASATEEETLEKLIFIIMRLNDNQLEMDNCKRMVQAQLKTVGITNIIDLDITENDEVAQNILMIQSQTKALSDQYKDLLDRYNKVLESLNATRKQREDKGKINSQTLQDKIKELQNRKFRERQGIIADVVKQATEKNMDKLREAVRFIDGEYSPLLLDSDTMEKRKEQDIDRE